MKINRKDIGNAAVFLLEKNYKFSIVSKKCEKWMREHDEFMNEPNKERRLLPIGELPKYFVDSMRLRYIDDWDDNGLYVGQLSDYVLFEGFDADTVTVGKHGDLDVRVCTDGAIIVLDGEG